MATRVQLFFLRRKSELKKLLMSKLSVFGLIFSRKQRENFKIFFVGADEERQSKKAVLYRRNENVAKLRDDSDDAIRRGLGSKQSCHLVADQSYVVMVSCDLATNAAWLCCNNRQ